MRWLCPAWASNRACEPAVQWVLVAIRPGPEPTAAHTHGCEHAGRRTRRGCTWPCSSLWRRVNCAHRHARVCVYLCPCACAWGCGCGRGYVCGCFVCQAPASGTHSSGPVCASVGGKATPGLSVLPHMTFHGVRCCSFAATAAAAASHHHRAHVVRAGCFAGHKQVTMTSAENQVQVEAVVRWGVLPSAEDRKFSGTRRLLCLPVCVCVCMCDCVAVWLCGCVAVWLCMWSCVCVNATHLSVLTPLWLLSCRRTRTPPPQPQAGPRRGSVAACWA